MAYYGGVPLPTYYNCRGRVSRSRRSPDSTPTRPDSATACTNHNVSRATPSSTLLKAKGHSQPAAVPTHDYRRTDIVPLSIETTLSVQESVVQPELELKRIRSAPTEGFVPTRLSAEELPWLGLDPVSAALPDTESVGDSQITPMPITERAASAKRSPEPAHLLKQVQEFIQGNRVNSTNNPKSLSSCSITVEPEQFELLLPLLPERIKYTYTSSNRTLIVHQLPTNYHEVGPLILHLLSSKFSKDSPTHNSHSLSELASQIIWSNGSPSIRNQSMPGKSLVERVPDASVGMPDRAYPTVVVEVGYSQGLRALRTAARSWLQMVEGEDQIELVILVEYTKRSAVKDDGGDGDGIGGNTNCETGSTSAETSEQEQEDVEHESEDRSSISDSPLAPAPVYLELWRNCPINGCRIGESLKSACPLGPSTRSLIRDARCHMCQRLKIYPIATSPRKQATSPLSSPLKRATFLLTDFVGSDALEDPAGTLRWEVPINLFYEAVHLKRTIAEAQTSVPRKKRLRAVEILAEEEEGVKGSVVEIARGRVVTEVRAQGMEHAQKSRRITSNLES